MLHSSGNRPVIAGRWEEDMYTKFLNTQINLIYDEIRKEKVYLQFRMYGNRQMYGNFSYTIKNMATFREGVFKN